MRIEHLLDSLKTVLEVMFREYRLPVNADSLYATETSDLPVGDQLAFDEYGEPIVPEAGDNPPYHDYGDDLDELKAPDRDETEDDLWEPKRRPQYGDPDWNKTRPPKVYVQKLPEPEDYIGPIPYILVQYCDSKDTYDKDTSDRHAYANIRLLIATYNQDGEQGARQTITMIDRICLIFRKGELLARQYQLQGPLDASFYTDDTGVYHLAEISMKWSLPDIARTEVSVEAALGMEEHFPWN